MTNVQTSHTHQQCAAGSGRFFGVYPPPCCFQLVTIYDLPVNVCNFGTYIRKRTGTRTNLLAYVNHLYGCPRKLTGCPRDLFGYLHNLFGSPNNLFGSPNNLFGSPRDLFGYMRNIFGRPNNLFGSPRDLFGYMRNLFGCPNVLFGRVEKQKSIIRREIIKN